MPPEKNPFLKHRLKLQKTEKVRLNSTEIAQLEELELTQQAGKIFHVRNAYLFSLYCAGIRVGDLLQLTPLNIEENLLVYRMDKTEKPRTILLHKKAKEILKIYNTTKTDVPIFPFLKKSDLLGSKASRLRRISSENAYMNMCCKKLGKLIGTEKHITMHTARHGFAELARKKKVDLYNISKALGHSSISITERYLESFDVDALEDTITTVLGD